MTSAPMTSALAVAHPNIALAKYWGKQAFGHNLPAVPSLSVTLAGMATRTRVTLDPGAPADTLALNGAPADADATARAAGLLDRVRARAGVATFARVESANDFPTSSGLASSASAFSALATAALAAYGVASDAADRSDLARRTSVSAARSAFGGFAELRAGAAGDERLAAEQVLPADAWAVAVVVAATTLAPKATASTAGMAHTAATSPFYPAWVADAPSVFARVKAALLARDLEALGDAVEASALAMHASAIAARPSVLYWTPATLEAMAAVTALRRRGVPAWATMDAGPHVKVLTTAADADRVRAAMGEVAGVARVLVATPGEGARVEEEP